MWRNVCTDNPASNDGNISEGSASCILSFLRPSATEILAHTSTSQYEKGHCYGVRRDSTYSLSDKKLLASNLFLPAFCCLIVLSSMLAPLLLALFASALDVSFAHYPPSQLGARTLSNPAQTSGFSTFDLLTIPGPQSRTFTSLPTIPSLCASYTSSSSECTATMQAFNITLGDCGSSWTMCRCTDADITLEEAVDHLARVPVGLRRNVGTVLIMKDTSAHAYTEASDIHFFGVCSQRTWVHEVRCVLF